MASYLLGAPIKLYWQLGYLYGTFKIRSRPQLHCNIKVLGHQSEFLSQLLHGKYRNWIMKHPGESRVPKKPVIHSVFCYFRGVNTITSTHDSEQAWLVNPIFSNAELRSLQEILFMVAMLTGLETGRGNTDTVWVLQLQSPQLSKAYIIFIVFWIFMFSGLVPTGTWGTFCAHFKRL